MRFFNWVGCVITVGLAGCSYYPIPDDVSVLSTEQIVRYARCEMRFSLLEHLNSRGILLLGSSAADAQQRIDAAKRKTKKTKEEQEKDDELLRLAKVAVVYAFDFNITEHNTATAGAGFRLPWLANVADASTTGTLDMTRQGMRVFGTEDRWGGLITNANMCLPERMPLHPQSNIIHPLTGSIGVDKVVKTFIDIDDQGGAKDNFVDTLTFTTQASGSADASVKLEPVPNQFRAVSATVGVGASRIDIHKLTISLTFPRKDEPDPNEGVVRKDGDLNAPFTRPADWRARYNLCVADARARENAFKILRLEAPEVYCVKYADAFSPQTGLLAERPIVVQMEQPRAGQRSQRSQQIPKAGAPGAVPPAVAPPQQAAPKAAAPEGKRGEANPAQPAPEVDRREQAPLFKRLPQFTPQMIRPNAPI
jgi:hypothetical protein